MTRSQLVKMYAKIKYEIIIIIIINFSLITMPKTLKEDYCQLQYFTGTYFIAPKMMKGEVYVGEIISK